MYDMTADLRRVDAVIAQGPYQADWGSLAGYTVPAWFTRAKLGIFIHWGVYSVPAFGSEWYSRNMYRREDAAFAHHRAVYGDHRDFGYKDFIPLFRAERFDPGAWADLFRASGARYVVPVAEHHDGFQMYKSDISHYNAFEMGPRRDVLGELRSACEARGLILGASSHRAEHWFFMSAGKEFPSDIHEPLKRGDLYWPARPEREHFDRFSQPAPDEEYLSDWLIRTCEIIDRYRPRMLYFDWWIQHAAFRPWLMKLAAYYYDRAAQWGTEVVITYKQDAFPFGVAVPDVERGQFAQVQPFPWQTDTATAFNSWSYTPENRFKEPADLVRDLVDVVSKNGCMLLNVGPKADGTICDADVRILEGIGRWMAANGEAIYGAKVFRRFGEGPTQVAEGAFSDGERKCFTSSDFRFTAGNGCVYAFAMTESADGAYHIATLADLDPQTAPFSGIIDGVDVLGWDRPPRWRRDAWGLHIETDYRTDYPITFRIRLR